MPINRGPMTQRKGHAQTPRKHQKITEFRLDGQVLCREGSLFALSVSRDKFYRVKTHYQTKERDWLLQERKAPRKDMLTVEDVKRVIAFIKNHADKAAINLPGRVPGYKNSKTLLLPSSTTKSALYKAYVESCEQIGQLLRNKLDFLKSSDVQRGPISKALGKCPILLGMLVRPASEISGKSTVVTSLSPSPGQTCARRVR